MLYSFEIALYIQIFLMYIYIIGTVKNEKEVIFISKILFLGALLESLIMISLSVIGHSIIISGLEARIDSDMRVGGTIGSPINAAGFYSLVLVPILSITFIRVHKLYKGIAIITFILGFISLFLTYSRGGWIAFLISSGLFFLIIRKRFRFSSIIPLSIALLSVVLVFPFIDMILTRLSDLETMSARMTFIKIAYRMISDNPFMGVGANNFALEINRYVTSKYVGDFLYVVHNRYLLVLAETGIFGLFTFLWFLFSTIRRGWQTWKIQHDDLSPLALAFFLSIIGNMVHMHFDIFHGRAMNELLWLFAALITSMRYIVTIHKSR
jgi:O-antigen ligase